MNQNYPTLRDTTGRKNMTDEQINASIAEICGWKEITNCTCGGKKRGCPPGGHTSSHVENYCTDLNAMHEAEKALTQLQTIFYEAHIYMRAPARLRAEAFLRTLGKWEEAK